MRKLAKNLLSNLLYLIPSGLRYEICRHHANKEFAENRSDFRTNGELWLIKKIFPRVGVVFDVGSHTGDWASHALRINPHISLHCFEPNRKAFKIFMNNVQGENVTVNCVGLGEKDGQQSFYVFDEIGEGSSLFRRKGLENIVGPSSLRKIEKVDIRTLDSYCTDKNIEEIDFMKIDVEGNELAVVKGGRNLFESDGVKIVQFEYGGTYIDSRNLLKDFYDFFEGLNYSFFLLYPDQVRHIPRYDQRLENFQYKNFVLVNVHVMKQIRLFQQSGAW